MAKKSRISSSTDQYESSPYGKSSQKEDGHAQLRVLHVDDDADQLMFTKIFIERCDPNISVKSLSHPFEVLPALSIEKFDCLVLDYQMDELDGVALTKQVRLNNNVPIIIYTGRGSEEVEVIARIAGADGYVHKETDPEHYSGLCAQICKIVKFRSNTIIED